MNKTCIICKQQVDVFVMVEGEPFCQGCIKYLNRYTNSIEIEQLKFQVQELQKQVDGLKGRFRF